MSQFAHGIRYFDATSLAETATPLTPMATHVLGVPHTTAASLVAHLQSIIWLTYRRDFAQMVPYEFTSDAGWGCMLRTAQMMLCEALLRNLPRHRETRFMWSDTHPLAPDVVHVLRSFVDAPTVDCAFAIHHMVAVGMKYDMLPGEWYGPTTAAQVLRDLVNAPTNSSNCSMCMYVPQDGVIYTEEINKLCVTAWAQPTIATATDVLYDPLLNPPTIDTSAAWSKSVFILVPLRLGLDKLNETYIPALTEVFELPQSLGIIGGKRGHSVYFVGARGHQFHILDPHTVHPTTEVDASFPSATHARTVHSTDHLVMEVDYIDPSLAVGFYCRDRADYVDLCRRLAAMARNKTCPITVADAKPDYTNDVELHSVSGESTGGDNDLSDEDDYVLI